MKINKIFTLVILYIAIDSQVLADEYTFGIKGGTMMNSASGASDATSIGFVTNFPLSNKISSIEAEITTSITGGGVGGGFDYDWDITTIAGYYTHNIHQGGFYLKLKAGLLYERVVISDNSPFPLDDVTESDTGLSYGIGAGWKIGEQNKLELEYTVIEQDISFVSASLYF